MDGVVLRVLKQTGSEGDVLCEWPLIVAFIKLAKQWHTINMIFMKLCFHEFFFRSFGGLDFGCSNRIQILVLKHHERSFSRILFFFASFYPQPLLASKALWKICSDLVQNF